MMELKSVQTALRLLSCFSTERPLIGVREFSAELGIATSAAHRIVTTFQTTGFLTQCPATKKYRLGVRLWELGALFKEQFKLNEVVQSLLDKAAAATGETVYVTFLDGTEAVCVQLAESPESVKLSIRLGERTPLYAGSRGRAMLANCEPATRDVVRASIPAERQHVLSDLVSEQALDNVRNAGHCVSRGERITGVVGLSIPIFVRGAVSASVTLGAPDSRLCEETIVEHLPMLRSLAGDIQRHLQNFT